MPDEGRARSQFVDGRSYHIDYQPTSGFRDKVLTFFLRTALIFGILSYDETLCQDMFLGFWLGKYGYFIILLL